MHYLVTVYQTLKPLKPQTHPQLSGGGSWARPSGRHFPRGSSGWVGVSALKLRGLGFDVFGVFVLSGLGIIGVWVWRLGDRGSGLVWVEALGIINASTGCNGDTW